MLARRHERHEARVMRVIAQMQQMVLVTHARLTHLRVLDPPALEDTSSSTGKVMETPSAFLTRIPPSDTRDS